MREAAADLEFETAARLRDEVKRLRETELAIADDPLARQSDVEDRAGAFAGDRKYGGAPKSAGGQTPAGLDPIEECGTGRRRGSDPQGLTPRGTSRIQRDYQPVQPTFAQTTTVPGSRIRKPALDEMGSARNRPIPARDGHEAPSARPGAAASSAPAEPAGGVGRRIAGASRHRPPHQGRRLRREDQRPAQAHPRRDGPPRRARPPRRRQADSAQEADRIPLPLAGRG